MANDFTQFEAECKHNILAQSADNQFQGVSKDFMLSATKYQYSYNFRWMGIPIIQYPQDILAMQEIIWTVKPDLIIETGVARGGSVIFYASMLELLGGNGMVIGIDIDIRKHNQEAIEQHSMAKRIKLINGYSSDNKIVIEQLEQSIHENKSKRVLVALDSLHSHAHVLNELNLYSKFVTLDSYIVVFDTHIESLDISSKDRPWKKGDNPMTAVDEFLKNNSCFVQDKHIESKLMLTVAPGGYLKRIKESVT